MKKIETTIDLSTIDCSEAARIWVRRGEAMWVYDPQSGRTESHDPMDRCGMPYRISDVVNPADCGNHWFLCCVADCYFPLTDLVRADSWEEAYEIYCDWACDHRHILIEEPDLKDYAVDSDNPTCQFTSDGKPIDTDNVHCEMCKLVRVDLEVREVKP